MVVGSTFIQAIIATLVAIFSHVPNLSNNGSLYTLVGGVDCKMGRWTLQGSIQYNQSQWMGLISQRTFVSPSVEYSITDKLSIQSTMHLPLYNSGARLA